MNNLLIQMIGAIAYVILAFSYFKKKKIEILFIQIFATIAFAIHYYFLSGITGTTCNILSLIIIIIIFIFEKYKLGNKKTLIICTIPLLILISLLTYENIFSIFPIIASVIVLITFLLDNENVIRFSGIISALCWLIYAVMYKSYIAIVFEIITIVTTTVAFFKNKKNQNSI